MYRVARKQAIAFESRDSLLMRLAVALHLTLDYELNAIVGDTGGVANTGTPNFIYRWTEHEIGKVMASADPRRVPTIRYFYDLRLPIRRFSESGNIALIWLARVVEPLSRVVAKLAPKQCNEFAFAISKTGPLHAWIDPEPGETAVKAAAE
jgi:hypothetical protein